MADERKVLDDTGQELDLLEAVDLFGDGRFDNKRAVAVDEEKLFHIFKGY
jgi:hypothetical protein